jgi:hypothetical protein
MVGRLKRYFHVDRMGDLILDYDEYIINKHLFKIKNGVIISYSYDKDIEIPEFIIAFLEFYDN